MIDLRSLDFDINATRARVSFPPATQYLEVMHVLCRAADTFKTKAFPFTAGAVIPLLQLARIARNPRAANRAQERLLMSRRGEHSRRLKHLRTEHGIEFSYHATKGRRCRRAAA